MAESPYPDLTKTSSIASSRRTSTATTSPSTSMSDLTQFMNHSTLSCRRTSFDSSKRHHYSSHPRDPHLRRHRHNLPMRRPSSSSSSSSSSRNGLQLSRIDSMINNTLMDSDSEPGGAGRGRNIYNRSSGDSAATSPSPSLSPSPYEHPAAGNSYFSMRHSRSEMMAPIPDTEDMTSRHQFQAPPDHTPTGGIEENGGPRKNHRVMKAIKMRRRKKEKHKGTEL